MNYTVLIPADYISSHADFVPIVHLKFEGVIVLLSHYDVSVNKAEKTFRWTKEHLTSSLFIVS